jgi:hypothetical protein
MDIHSTKSSEKPKASVAGTAETRVCHSEAFSEALSIVSSSQAKTVTTFVVYSRHGRSFDCSQSPLSVSSVKIYLRVD